MTNTATRRADRRRADGTTSVLDLTVTGDFRK